MTLTGIEYTTCRVGGWTAVWRTPNGNIIKDRLPFSPVGTSEVDAWIYALDHYPSWEAVR